MRRKYPPPPLGWDQHKTLETLKPNIFEWAFSWFFGKETVFYKSLFLSSNEKKHFELAILVPRIKDRELGTSQSIGNKKKI